MSPNIGDPSYSQVPDPRLHSQPPREPPFQQTCRQKGCGGKVNPQTGKCLRCGFLHGKSTARYNPLVPSQKPITPIHPVAPPLPSSDAKTFTDKIPEPPISHSNVESQYPPSGSTFSKESPTSQYISSGYSKFEQDNFFKKILDRVKEFSNTAAFWWTIRGTVILLFGFTGFWIYQNVDCPAVSTANPNPFSNTPLVPAAGQIQLQTYDLIIDIEHPEGGSVSRDPNETSYKSGTSVTLSAQPAGEYVFDKWSGDVDIADNANTTTVIMDSNKQITAHFKVLDTTPPEISEIHVVKYSDTTATIAWKASENATGYVKYKRGDTGEYIKSAPSASDAMDNQVKLNGLRPNGIYYYIVELVDASGNTATSKSQVLSTPPPIKEGYEEGNRAPNLALIPYENYSELPITNGKLELSQYLGEKKLYINFWSTYCAPCIVEFPVLQVIYEKPEYHEGWEMITICIDGREDRIVKLKEKYPDLKLITLPTLFYAEGADQDAYHIWKVPTSFFIDEDGIIRNVKLGRFYNTQEVKDVLDSI